MPRHPLCTAVVVSVLVGMPLRAQTPATSSPPVDVDAAFAAALPPPAESRWTLVPWRHSLTDALVEAKQTKRPIYLFVNDGDTGSARC